MKKWFAAVFALAMTLGFLANSAEAARIGGGRSMGVQRAAPTQRQATPPAAAPQQASPRAAPATPSPQPAGNRWFGPLAGIAAGLGLGWLLGQGGMGGWGGALLMALLVGVVVMILARMFVRPREVSARMQYANWDNQAATVPPPAGPELKPDNPSETQPHVPGGFDTETFLKQATRNFLQLQEANDRADLTELREVTTTEMFEALKGDIIARGSRQQLTEIISIDATLLEVATEGNLHWASVRFCGNVRESPHSAPKALNEVWNLQKPVSGETGWLLAGVQQIA